MSDIDDLEEIAEQCRTTVNEKTRNTTKKQRDAYRRMMQKGANANRSVEKQQARAMDRRRVLVIPENQS